MLVVKEITIPSFVAEGRGCLQAEDGLSNDDRNRLLDCLTGVAGCEGGLLKKPAVSRQRQISGADLQSWTVRAGRTTREFCLL